jgi:hypothetical protein
MCCQTFLAAVDLGDLTALVLLNLSAAFDTVEWTTDPVGTFMAVVRYHGQSCHPTSQTIYSAYLSWRLHVTFDRDGM